MKHVMQEVWTDDNGSELIRRKNNDEFYIPLSTVSLKTVKELHAALSNIMSNENNLRHITEAAKS